MNLFKKYEEDIYRMAYVYVKNSDDALDVVQETAYKSFTQIKTLKNPEYFKTWLIRIAINISLDFLKKQKKIVYLNTEHTDSLSTNPEDASLQITLESLMERLTEQEKSIVLLRYYADQTMSEIAKTLDIPLGTVKTVLYRALNKLRTQMTREDIYEQ
ncbi:sigma-70 family RNA polymerase sigma factor [Ornithinibacillus sp. 4-3]|uniref:Sigma-70 family RNA polymerase sigma factor n=1 Tax=Ornithinibacillus sp. 4-3 TaxID=3231488 RepID=A0AB39HXJ6_9BACI